MSSFSKLVLLFTGIIAICALIIGTLAINYATNVTSDRIVDNTIQEKDLKNELQFKFQFPDGQIIDATLLNKDTATNTQVFGAQTAKGDIKVIVRDDQLVIDPGTIVVTNDMIARGTIQAVNLGFDTLSSIDNMHNNAGNIDIIPGNGISVSNNDSTKQITIALSNTSFFTNASNLATGTLSTDLYSAYADLTAEGRLNLSDPSDLLTLQQGDARYLKLSGGTITGELSVTGGLGLKDITNVDTYIKDLNGRIGNLEGIVKESKVESGILGCEGKVTPAAPLTCNYEPAAPILPGPKKRISSIVATPISEQNAKHLFVTLKGDPSGRTSAAFVISTDNEDGQVIEGLSYIAIMQ
jgi:hypothetical protein